MLSLVSVGADPEFFVTNEVGMSVPICGLLGGTKEEPIKIFEGDPYSGIQEDNVMVEFNIHPSTSADMFESNISRVMEYLVTKLQTKGLTIDISPSVEFKEEQLLSQQARHMGCMGDYNAWTKSKNPMPSPALLGKVRTSGGHVHVAFIGETGKPTLDEKLTLVKGFDIILGAASVLLDNDNRRRKFYGRAGAFRPKDYGVEYRTLSNFWIKSPNLIRWVFTQVQNTINRINEDKFFVSKLEFEKEWVVKAIEEGDKGIAERMVKRYGVELP